MTWVQLARANLRLSPLTTIVNITLMSLGTASIVLLLLASTQLSETLSRDARGIDLVLGATGSPIQLVLSSVYHADVPTGNISQHDAERWADDNRVAIAVPLALGDSYRGFRIVGTTLGYADLYDGAYSSGGPWANAMEAVVGSAAHAAGLDVGSQFSGAHGLSEDGEQHDSQPYRVVGVLAPTGSVLDRLILTSVESVWDLHSDDHDDADDEDAHDTEEHEHSQNDREITAMLIRYQSPLAAMTLPREINAGGTLQAASPAMEISRVLRLVGIGFNGLRAFSWVLILTAALSVFAALYASLRARQTDLAMLRCLGATRWELLLVLLLEGLLLTGAGVAIGFLVAHGVMELLGHWLASTRGVSLTGWTWVAAETMLLIGLFGVGIVAAVVPAVQAYRTDVAGILAKV